DALSPADHAGPAGPGVADRPIAANPAPPLVAAMAGSGPAASRRAAADPRRRPVPGPGHHRGPDPQPRRSGHRRALPPVPQPHVPGHAAGAARLRPVARRLAGPALPAGILPVHGSRGDSPRGTSGQRALRRAVPGLQPAYPALDLITVK